MFARLSQLPLREQAGLGIACVFVLFLIADRIVVKPVSGILGRMDVEIAVADQQSDQNREVLQYEASVQARYEQVKNLIGISAAEQDSLESFNRSVDEMALRNAISLKSMQHLPPDATDFLVTYFVEVSDFESETQSLLNFLHEIQSAPGMLRVQKISLASQDESTTVKGSLVISKVMTLAGEQE